MKTGFVKTTPAKSIAVKSTWPGWRGPGRDGIAHWLPDTLPAKPNVVWERPLREQGLAGVAATEDLLIVADRELGDSQDVFHGIDARTGKDRWAVRYPIGGSLDYGNSPRATPLIQGGHAWLFGAFGHLTCVQLETGDIEWDMDVRQEYGVKDKLAWGTCASPLIVDGRLIINPGAADASIVALDPQTGDELWKVAGDPAAYASFVVAEFGGKRQLIGYDKHSLGGWDPATGKRLWKLVPPIRNDFNVPTPVVAGENLLIATENNGARLYGFDNEGRINPTPLAVNRDLAPDSHTPVVLGNRVFGVWNELFCLDLKDGLKTLWSSDDQAFANYASILAHGQRALVTTTSGELILLDAAANTFRVLGRLKLFKDDAGVYSHPALVGTRLFIRGSTHLRCVDLAHK